MYLTVHYLALPHLTLHYLFLHYLTFLFLTLSFLTLPYPILSYRALLTLPVVLWPQLCLIFLDIYLQIVVVNVVFVSRAKSSIIAERQSTLLIARGRVQRLPPKKPEMGLSHRIILPADAGTGSGFSRQVASRLAIMAAILLNLSHHSLEAARG